MRRLLLLAASAAILAPASAMAQAIIDNGTVQLGVNRGGALNVDGGPPSAATNITIVGLRSVATNNEATADGCTCEGWGAAVAGTGPTVYQNTANANSFVEISFASTASTATSVVRSTDGRLEVMHHYAPSTTQYLYQVDVTITNISATDFTGNTLYRRTMDWDIEPTPFDEYSTIGGTAGAANVLSANNNGFCNSNPLVSCTELFAGGTGDFVDLGPADHGANFDFFFDPLVAGAARTLTIFYGVAPTERLAFGALASVGAEIYSFGQSNEFGVPGDETFIFGFKGVGGTVVDGAIPEPGTWALMILGFGAAGAALRRRRSMIFA
jgi:type IV pilus assembly protein PilY1